MWQCPQRNLTLTLHLGLVSVEASDDALSSGYELVPSVLAFPLSASPSAGHSGAVASAPLQRSAYLPSLGQHCLTLLDSQEGGSANRRTKGKI